jgi:hypothetical protein
MYIYPVFHTEHKKNHLDEEGDLNIFGKSIQRLLGVYTTKEDALAAVDRMRVLPGFDGEPDCFFVDEFTYDEVFWEEGFTSD